MTKSLKKKTLNVIFCIINSEIRKKTVEMRELFYFVPENIHIEAETLHGFVIPHFLSRRASVITFYLVSLMSVLI